MSAWSSASHREFVLAQPATAGHPAVYKLRIDHLSYEQWQPDNAAARCRHCTKDFGLLHWRHHCRACGVVSCDEHAPTDELHDTRVCVDCLAALEKKNRAAAQQLQRQQEQKM